MTSLSAEDGILILESAYGTGRFFKSMKFEPISGEESNMRLIEYAETYMGNAEHMDASYKAIDFKKGRAVYSDASGEVSGAVSYEEITLSNIDPYLAKFEALTFDDVEVLHGRREESSVELG